MFEAHLFTLLLIFILKLIRFLILGIFFLCLEQRFSTRSQVTAEGLLSLDSLEQSLKVTGTKTLMVSALNNFNEEGRPVLNGLGEDLEQITLLVIVDEDLLLADNFDVLLDFETQVLHTLKEAVIVGIGNFVKEFNTTLLHSADCGHNIVRAESDVLDTIATVVLNIFLDLALSATVGGLVNGHFDVFIKVSDDNRAEGRELSVHHLVIHRPEAMEIEHLLVPRGSGLHFALTLVADTVVHE